MTRVLILISILLNLFSCTMEKRADRTGKASIVTTTGMIEDAVKNIVKDSANVLALMGPGVDPHLYKATQGDLERLTNADYIFYNGLHLEGKMGEVLEKLARIKPVIAMGDGLEKADLIADPQFQSAIDPHIWFDVQRWKNVVQFASKKLIELEPENTEYYAANTLIYMDELDQLHKYVKNEISTIPNQQRVLITAHDAFGYFGQAYEIEVRGLQGISTVAEFGLRDITDLVKFIIDRKIKAVFVETSVSEKSINAVVEGCKNQGHNVVIGGSLYSDAMGEKGTEEGNYIGMVKANVQLIVQALK